MAELLLQGNELDRVYSFQPLSGRGMAATSYVFSYGYAIPASLKNFQHFGLGINLKYIRGHYFSVVDQMTVTTVTRFISTAAQGTARLRTAEGGSGFWRRPRHDRYLFSALARISGFGKYGRTNPLAAQAGRDYGEFRIVRKNNRKNI